MRLIQATFTVQGVIALRDALAEETVRMRKHVTALDWHYAEGEIGYDHTIGARKLLAELEALLSWAKEQAGKPN